MAFVACLMAPPARSKPIQQARDEILAETLVYLNVPYLWGGLHPRTGLDCSAFVQLVYKKTGLTLPRNSREQFASTRYLAPGGILPGDLVFFSMKKPGSRHVDHVGIYLGKGFFVHASLTQGIHVNHLEEPYYWQRLVSIRRYPGF